jgi:hypothetical protein
MGDVPQHALGRNVEYHQHGAPFGRDIGPAATHLRLAFAAADATRLRALLVGTNITVLTSSSAAQLSREDPQWGNGAFTEIVLEALSRRADANRNGLISVSELTGYLTCHVPGFTNGAQHPGVEMRFDGDVFVAGPPA